MRLVLDGVASVEVDGEIVAEIRPGAVMGERALIEGGRRTAHDRVLRDDDQMRAKFRRRRRGARRGACGQPIAMSRWARPRCPA